jgi:hypothetical protein
VVFDPPAAGMFVHVFPWESVTPVAVDAALPIPAPRIRKSPAVELWAVPVDPDAVLPTVMTSVDDAVLSALLPTRYGVPIAMAPPP